MCEPRVRPASPATVVRCTSVARKAARPPAAPATMAPALAPEESFVGIMCIYTYVCGSSCSRSQMDAKKMNFTALATGGNCHGVDWRVGGGGLRMVHAGPARRSWLSQAGCGWLVGSYVGSSDPPDGWILVPGFCLTNQKALFGLLHAALGDVRRPWATCLPAVRHRGRAQWHKLPLGGPVRCSSGLVAACQLHQAAEWHPCSHPHSQRTTQAGRCCSQAAKQQGTTLGSLLWPCCAGIQG